MQVCNSLLEELADDTVRVMEFNALPPSPSEPKNLEPFFDQGFEIVEVIIYFGQKVLENFWASEEAHLSRLDRAES